MKSNGLSPILQLYQNKMFLMLTINNHRYQTFTLDTETYVKGLDRCITLTYTCKIFFIYEISSIKYKIKNKAINI